VLLQRFVPHIKLADRVKPVLKQRRSRVAHCVDIADNWHGVLTAHLVILHRETSLTDEGVGLVRTLGHLCSYLLKLGLSDDLFAGPEHIQEGIYPEEVLDASAHKPNDVVEGLVACDGCAVLGKCEEEDRVDSVVDCVGYESVGADVQLA